MCSALLDCTLKIHLESHLEKDISTAYLITFKNLLNFNKLFKPKEKLKFITSFLSI